jgi:3-oxoacyl-[acyl-carrier protein] reductase
LGASIVQSFLDLGDRVATCSRAASDATSAWASDPETAERFLYEQVDLADRGQCDRFVMTISDRFGGIDVLVNNAGVARDGVLGLFSDEDVDVLVDLNLKGTFHMTKLVLRRMLRHGGGRIINISSIVGLSGYRGLSVYGATKAGLDGFTRALAREVGSRGITVNSVAPGYLNTDMSHGLDEAQLGQIVRRTPLGRLGEGEDVAAAVQFLASERGGFITGQVLVVDGGLTA